MSAHYPEKLIPLLNQSIQPFSVKNELNLEHFAGLIGDARIVLIGEATHGTEEFYQTRIALTEHLIYEYDFQTVAIEGDFTSVYPAQRYLQGEGDALAPEMALNDFKRFPAWMWRNQAFRDFLARIRAYNDHAIRKIGIYGLDLYCLHSAIQAVIDYLKARYPDKVEEAIARYACFDHQALNPQTYGYLIEQHLKDPCIEEVTSQYLDMQALIQTEMAAHFKDDQEGPFYALQNARLVKNAEAYYRALFESHYKTWNIRDNHMAETLKNIMEHLEHIHQKPAKIIVWAHNSHIGDARATEMSEKEELNLGQLVRERFGKTSFLLGFSTYQGQVIAASEWGGDACQKEVLPALPGSYEHLFHLANQPDFLLDLRNQTELTPFLEVSRLQRAIGVIYLPETERISHYYFSHLPHQFDALIHIDQTSALSAIDRHLAFADEEPPDTYPEGI